MTAAVQATDAAPPYLLQISAHPAFEFGQYVEQEVRTTGNSRPLRPHIQCHSRSLTYPIENLYTQLPISD